MNQPKTLFALAAFFIVCLSLNNTFAQTPPAKPSEPSFDVILQTVVASNDAGKPDAAGSLSNVVKKLKADFPFSNYRLSSTSMLRIKNNGSSGFRTVNFATEKKLAVFTDWKIDDLITLVDGSGQEMMQMRTFSFYQRVPITNLNTEVLNYEQLGLTAEFSLPKNTPTIVGSLTEPISGALMFLVMTVRAAEK